MNDSHAMYLVAKPSTSHFQLSSQPPQIDLLQTIPSLSLVHCHRASQLLHQLVYAAPTQSDQPLSVTCFIWAHCRTALSYSKVAIPMKYNLIHL